MSFTSLPEAILHLICAQLTPSRATVDDSNPDPSPSIHQSVINLALTCRSISRIAKSHIATNISLTDCSVRYDLFLRTVLASPTYAANVRYLKLCEGSHEEWLTSRPTAYHESEAITPLFAALSNLQALYSHKGESLYPGSIVWRLTSEAMPLQSTLEILRFDHVNVWGERRVAQIQLVREVGTGIRSIVGWEQLTGALKNLSISKFLDWPMVHHIKVTCLDGDDDGDEESDGDWEDEEDSWDEDDDSDYDSEDSSDYEDDWEAEGGLGGIADVPVPSKVLSF